MDGFSTKGTSMFSSPLSSPNVAAFLHIKIISWSQETGLPVSVRVTIANRTFNLHKYPLFSKSGYFQRKLKESNEVELPHNFPGGPEIFEMIALFIYGSSTLVDPFNVAALRCAAEFLEMTQEYGSSANLCDRFDIYLNQVVLQKWDDTIIVLHSCQLLLPLAEELVIVSRCIESLAFMACMEILDPEKRRENSVVTIEALSKQNWTWSGEISLSLNEILNQELWIKDLIALPFSFFKRIITSLRRQGMKEKYVSPIILFYANNRVMSSCAILEGVVDLLPMGKKASKLIPVGFYFSLLSRSLELGSDCDVTQKIQDRIVSILHLSRVEDFLGIDSVNVIESMFSAYVSSSFITDSVVAELWDMYLSHIAADPELNSGRFMNLIEIVPLSSRQTHDYLYKALNNFLVEHPTISQDEKGMVCKYLNCQKLSLQVCIDAVQNDLMPLRLIVQALFVQQQVSKECSESFRYGISSSIYANSNSPYSKGSEGGRQTLGVLLKQNDIPIHRSEPRTELSRTEYESTSFRIQNLEQELISLKTSFQLHNISKKTKPFANKLESHGSGRRILRNEKNAIGQVTNCIGSVSLTSQRKYAGKLMKILRRISLFGKGRSKGKPSATSPRTN